MDNNVYFPKYEYNRNYVQYLKDNNLFALNQLTGEARQKALQEVYDMEQNWFNDLVRERKEFIKTYGIHHWINNNGRENKAMVKLSSLLKRFRNEPRYFEAFVLDNLQEFYSDGTRFVHFPHIMSGRKMNIWEKYVQVKKPKR